MTCGDRSNAGRGPKVARAHRRQGGFTLVELMLALLVSSLLIGMILAIFARISLAYRGQQQIAGVQQVLAAARAMIELDAKQAGLGMAQGFYAAPTGRPPAPAQSPVQVFDSSTGPDQVAFFYADPSTQAVTTGTGWPASLDLDSATGFSPGDLIVLSTADTADGPATKSPYPNSPYTGLPEANITNYTACVVQIDPNPGSVIAGPPASIQIAGSATAPWGGTNHCPAAPAQGTMVYKFVAHAYRIDTSTPARAALGPLQQSVTGGLLGDGEVWNELAYGFTDLQTAERFVLQGASVDSIDPDGDGDVVHDWYSDVTQQAMNTVPLGPAAPVTVVRPVPLMAMSISLVARTDRDVEGIATQATPNLLDPLHPNNNPLGDRASIALPSNDPALRGQRIYRYITFQVDFRNLGVGL